MDIKNLKLLPTKAEVGFTLAEVLITLGIIGIVATLTIPSLINNYQKKQTVTKLQKAISVLNQAYKLAYDDVGEPTPKAALDMGKGKRTAKKRKTRQKDRDAGRICDLHDKKLENRVKKHLKTNLFVFSQTLLRLKPFEDVQ